MLRPEEATAQPPRQIVICCDGTNNTLTAGTADTNVLRLYAHLAANPAPGRVLYYDPGVGTLDAAPPTDPADWLQRSVRRIAGLASGRGVYDNIELAYRFVMQYWRDERDRIYVFGFSRGAFTARCVVGMVNLFGVLSPQHEALLPTLIRVYFSQPSDRKGGTVQQATRAVHHAVEQRHAQQALAPMAGLPRHAGPVTREALARQVRELFTTPAGREAWVHWTGVWDTVESVGLPGPLSRSNPATATLRGKRIRHVRHALSFDEHRWTFEPRLYEEPGDIDDPATGQTVKQRWFHGVHGDVGGGYAAGEAGLSDEALRWMVREVAADLGVPAIPTGDAQRIVHDALWSSPWWALTGMSLRNAHPSTSTGEPIEVSAGSAAAGPLRTVWERPRPLAPVFVALVLGLASLLLSGACLTGFGDGLGLWTPRGASAAAQAAARFASEQLQTIALQGLLTPGRQPWWHPGQPAWAMVWDLGFIACWGYLLGRASSRAFAWLAGLRGPGAPMPAWRWLGMAPLFALNGDLAEDAMTLAALALHGMGTDLAAGVCLWLGAVGSVVKFGGLLACVPLLAVRVWIALPGVKRWRC
jgi:uncharacterized protein (DUF2235 family)